MSSQKAINTYVLNFLRSNKDLNHESLVSKWNNDYSYPEILKIKNKNRNRVQLNSFNSSRLLTVDNIKHEDKVAVIAHSYFRIHTRPIIRTEMPNLNSIELNNETVTRWKRLILENPEKYQEYIAKAERYFNRLNQMKQIKIEQKKKNEVNNKGTTVVPKTVNKQKKSEPEVKPKKKKKYTGPKRPINGFVFFCKKMRPVLKEENIPARNAFIELAERWLLLKEENPEKAKEFFEKAHKDKMRYVKESWESRTSDECNL